jgi:hypothetical protein
VSASNGEFATLTCPAGTEVLSIDAASYGTATSSCPVLELGDCNAATSVAVVAAVCVGQPTCTLYADPSTFGGADPCDSESKTLNIVATCGPPPWCAAAVPQGVTASFACSLGTVVTGVDVVSYGNASGVCGNFTVGACDVAGAATVVAAACLGQRSCSLPVTDAVFGDGGDACAGANRTLSASVTCGAPTFACSAADAGGNATLTCPLQGSNITSVNFATCGTPAGICPNFTDHTCSGNDVAAVEGACLGSCACSFPVAVDTMPVHIHPVGAEGDDSSDDDSCGTMPENKYLDVAVSCSPPELLCASATEGDAVTLTCNPGYAISAIDYAAYGTPSGSCGDGGLVGDGGGRRLHVDDDGGSDCSATTSLAVVAAACVGQNSCTVTASDDTFGGGDPCTGSKSLLVTATCALFAPPLTVCAAAPFGSYATLTCPPGYAVAAINFASFGTPNGPCPYFQTSTCHATSSVDVVAAACLWQNTCTVLADSDTFGDPGCVSSDDPAGVQLVIAAECAAVVSM